MTDYPGMIDPIPQIRAALAGLETSLAYRVTEQWPQEVIAENLITLTEISNTNTDVRCVDLLSVQVDIWSQSADPVRELAPLVNDAIMSIGFRRQSVEQLNRLPDKGGYYRKMMRFGRKVDKRTLRLID